MSPLAPLDVRLMNACTVLLLLVFVAGASLGAVRWIARLPVFALARITVVGDTSHSNALTLRANVAPNLRGTFFSVDLAQARAAFEAVPWVRRAVVRRELPNRLRVTLQEQQAVAYWGPDSETRLINSYGEIFDANTGEVEQDSLPRLEGPDARAAEVLAMYQALVPLFEHLDLSLDELELSNGGSWHAGLDSGASVELGRGTQAEVTARTHKFLATLTQIVSRYGRTADAIESADLRHDNGYAIRLQGVTTASTDGKNTSERK